MKDERQAREELLRAVAEYCETYHNQKKPLKRDKGFPMLQECMIKTKW